jgi:hypothetical protein
MDIYEYSDNRALPARPDEYRTTAPCRRGPTNTAQPRPAGAARRIPHNRALPARPDAEASG